MKKTYTAEQVLSMLESHDFDCWFQKDFNDYVVGRWHGEAEKSRQEILKDLEELL